ncbi:ABC transporter permease [Parvularcula sp. IMCC14364]|uniref:ABC transporter permease n=1 Tax=Parvularcula sp. IMCC14364 TaxID=3067902 RepID=UPI002741CE2C|nr:ABC transporter permease [Parvularcula sp. IMCC14364]
MNILTALSRECAAETLKFLRAPEFLLPTIAFPVIFYSIFGVMMGRGGPQAAYLLATFGVFAVMGPAMFGFGVGVAMEKDRGWLDLKRVAPMPVWIYLVSKLFGALIFSAFTLAILYAVGGWLGGVELARPIWGQLVLVHLSVTLPFALLGLTIGFLVKGNGAVAITNLIFLGLALLGGLWMPASMFPDWFQAVGSLTPSYHAGQTALSVIGMGDDTGQHLSVLGLYTAGFAALAMIAWGLQRR